MDGVEWDSEKKWRGEGGLNEKKKKLSKKK